MRVSFPVSSGSSHTDSHHGHAGLLWI